jgi:DNA-binding NtrC family response regulator
MGHRDILIVDDEISLLVLLERIITERTPYSVMTTASSIEAAKEVEERDFELLITDLKMPNLDGLDLLQRVKQLKKDMEVIIITAFGSAEVAVEAMKQGAYDYITKPFRKEQILITIDRAMRWRRLKSSVAELERRIFGQPYESALDSFRAEYAHRAVARYAGDLQLAARATGLSRDTLLAYCGLQPDLSHHS